jgi:hypothetical protein
VGSGLGNYTITYADGAFTVNPKALTITASDQSKTYGDIYTFAGTEFATIGLVNSDAVDSVTLTSSGAPATATVIGSPYYIVASAAVGSGLGNYTITYVDGSLTVNLKALTIDPNDLHKTYGDTYTFAGTEFTTLGLVNSDAVTSVTLSSDGTPAIANVGGHDIIADLAVGTGLGNYTITYGIGSLIVDSKALTITANDQSKTYGDTFTFEGTEFTTLGLVNSDAVDSVTLGSSGTPATASVTGSPYDIVVSDALGEGLGNYTISYVKGSFTVDPKALTVTANDQSKNYGDIYTFAGTEFATLGLINSDAVDSVTLTSDGATATASVTGSPYDIVASAGVGSGLGNYTITYVNGSLTVDPIPLTITSNDQSKTYGDTFTFAGTGFTTLGLVNSDAVDSVTLTSDGAPATASVTGSPYEIVVSDALGTGLDNYIISYTSGFLTVDKRTITVMADAKSKPFGTADPELTYSITGSTADGDILTVVLTREPGETVGSYAILGELTLSANAENYQLAYIGDYLTIIGYRLYLPLIKN